MDDIIYPQINIWGPSLWFLLHALSFKSMSMKMINLNFYWNKIFMNLRHCIPCPLCKSHYNDYITLHYKELYNILKNNNWNQLQEWIWTFHNNVRQRKGQTVDFTYDSLLSTFSNVSQDDLMTHYRIVEDQFRKGMHLHIYTRDQLNSFIHILFDLVNGN